MTTHLGQTAITKPDGDAGDEITRYIPSTKRGGQWVRMGLEEFRLPPLGFLDIQELGPDVAALREVTGAPTAEQWKSVHSLVWAAMRRNYPQSTLEDVKDRVDLGNWLAVINAVLGISGYERKEAAPGEK